MKLNVSYDEFYRAFQDIPRHFSDTGLKILYDSLTSLEEKTGKEIELNVIAFCSEYNEYSLEEYNNEYDTAFEDMEDLKAYLHDRTYVCGYDSDDDVIVFKAY